MRFRPCIDIHNGQVKQIVGGSLSDKTGSASAKDNFVSRLGAEYYAGLYRSHGLYGGHVIILNPAGSPFYQADLEQAKAALSAFPDGLQIGGGVNETNAGEFLEMGASHVIVTSYVFNGGKIDFERLGRLESAVGKDRLVLDLSCRKKDGRYFIVTDRWQTFTDTALCQETIETLSSHCSEFLIHAVDAEGKAGGVEKEVAKLMGSCCRIPATYAGGIASLEDISLLEREGGGRIDFTVGSALDLFGGKLPFDLLAGYR